MKKIDFSHAGKMPLTQDRLAYLQAAYKEALEGIAALSGHTAGPYTMSGCEISRVSTGGTTYDYSVTAGWMFFEGKLRRVPAQTISVDTSVNQLFFQISNANTPLTFYDGSAPTVVLDNTLVLQSLVIATPETSSLFKRTSIKPFGREKEWTPITLTLVTAGDVSGTINYKKNFLANTLSIRGTLTAATTPAFDALPSPTFYTMDTLPAAYMPTFEGKFFCRVTTSPVPEISGSGSSDEYIRHLNGRVKTTGEIEIEWLQFIGPSGTYSIDFSAIIPLD